VVVQPICWLAQTVPKIKEQLLVENESQAKGSLLLALGMLIPRVASHEECLQFFNEQWNLVKESDDESVKFCIAACIARLYLEQKPPKFVLEQLLKAVGNEETKIEYHVSTLVNDILINLNMTSGL